MPLARYLTRFRSHQPVNYVGVKNARQLETFHSETLGKLVDSPAFRQAMDNLGIHREDLVRRTLEDFKEEGVTEQVL